MLHNWFGIYCPQHDCWMKNTDGVLIFYPAKEIAQAHISEGEAFLRAHGGYSHLWEPMQFGKQKQVLFVELPVGSPRCPVL